MSSEVTSETESTRTNSTGKGSLLQMDSFDMLDHIAMQGKGDIASLTNMLSPTLMTFHMTIQIGTSSKPSSTHVTRKRSLAFMRRSHMFHQKILMSITRAASLTFERPHIFMHGSDMFLHIGIGLERSLARFTHIFLDIFRDARFLHGAIVRSSQNGTPKHIIPAGHISARLSVIRRHAISRGHIIGRENPLATSITCGTCLHHGGLLLLLLLLLLWRGLWRVGGSVDKECGPGVRAGVGVWEEGNGIDYVAVLIAGGHQRGKQGGKRICGCVCGRMCVVSRGIRVWHLMPITICMECCDGYMEASERGGGEGEGERERGSE